jgi:Mor family transcriptional regulator
MTSPALIDRLNTLCAIAERAGTDAAWLRETVDGIAALILERCDPRRRRSLAKAAQMANALKAMREQGFTHGAAVAALSERYRLCKSQVYALLKMFPGT